MSEEILFDLAWFRPAPTNQALELLFKARQEGDDDFIWSLHDSPLIQTMIELFTKRGLMRLESVKKALLRWQAHGEASGVLPAPKPIMGLMTRWSADEKALVQIYLESLPKSQWQLSDHMLSVELVVQTYLPEQELISEAQWLATKATLMGKVQNNWTKKKEPTVAEANAILEHLPNTPEQAAMFPLTPNEQTTLEFANFRAVENVVNLADNVRRDMRALVAKHVEKQIQGDTTGSTLQTELFDQFAELNRDWRRIAITEAGEAHLQGMIAGAKSGDKVKRVEQYPSACAFCKKIHGVIATVVDATHPNKDPDTMIWPGKNNIGRSAAPRKRVGGILIKRTPEEMYWLPAGLAHPHCRGRWVPVAKVEGPQDPAFAAILQSFLES
ncbi:hypothetical protein D7B12_17910 [Salmonella enterica]|nr:hypothetical protein [Salmonella enterica]